MILYARLKNYHYKDLFTITPHSSVLVKNSSLHRNFERTYSLVKIGLKVQPTIFSNFESSKLTILLLTLTNMNVKLVATRKSIECKLNY